MSACRVLTVGKVRKPHWQGAAEEYLLRLRRMISLETVHVGTAPASLPQPDRLRREADNLRAKLSPRDGVICMDEHGERLTSPEFSDRLGRWLERPDITPCFVVGGAYGLDPGLRSSCMAVLSLSDMTLPHELAFVLLLEQIYRALTIRKGIPYHNS